MVVNHLFLHYISIAKAELVSRQSQPLTYHLFCCILSLFPKLILKSSRLPCRHRGGCTIGFDRVDNPCQYILLHPWGWFYDVKDLFCEITTKSMQFANVQELTQPLGAILSPRGERSLWWLLTMTWCRGKPGIRRNKLHGQSTRYRF